MIDVCSDELLTLKAVAKMLPSGRAGKRVHFSTVFRWATNGVRGVKLETVKVGHTRYTTREALNAFVEHLSCADATPEPEPTPKGWRTPAQRARDHAAAERRLDEAGIK